MTIVKSTPLLYGIAVATFALGLICRLMNWSDPVTMLIVCLIAQYVFAFCAIYDVRYSSGFNDYEKSRWPTLLLLIPLPFGFFYIRKKLNERF